MSVTRSTSALDNLALTLGWLFFVAPLIGAAFPYLLLPAHQGFRLQAPLQYAYAFINGGLVTMVVCGLAACFFALRAADELCAQRNGYCN